MTGHDGVTTEIGVDGGRTITSQGDAAGMSMRTRGREGGSLHLMDVGNGVLRLPKGEGEMDGETCDVRSHFFLGHSLCVCVCMQTYMYQGVLCIMQVILLLLLML